MDFELKEFEDKINNITEQFMSLLDSNDVIEASIMNKIENKSDILDKKYQGNIGQDISCGNTSAFCLKPDELKFGGISYGNDDREFEQGFPLHAVKFDSIEQLELNQKLEKLYNEKRSTSKDIFADRSAIAFSDSNIAGINRMGSAIQEGYAKIQTDSTIKKEVYDMSNNGAQEKKENVFYSFATIPAERAMTEKKDWKEVLFMDVPWNTKIDIWGGFKSLCNVNVEFTF